MICSKQAKKKIGKMVANTPFTAAKFSKLGSRNTIDKSLSLLVKEGVIHRVRRGVFVKPKKNKFVGTVSPDVSSVVAEIVKKTGETIQIHGAEAARRFRLSTQMPMMPIFLTSGTSRTLKIGGLSVRFMHTSNARRLQYAGKKIGLALSALFYLGKEQVTAKEIALIRQQLSEKEFQKLRACEMPEWMRVALKA